jgi:hypothetical protein
MLETHGSKKIKYCLRYSIIQDGFTERPTAVACNRLADRSVMSMTMIMPRKYRHESITDSDCAHRHTFTSNQ